MGDRSGMSISADSPSDETLNRGPRVLLLGRQYEFPFGINIVPFSFFFVRTCISNADYQQFSQNVRHSGDRSYADLIVIGRQQLKNKQQF